MKKLFTSASLIAGLITIASAHAEVGVTGDFGSTGIGAHATIPLTPSLNARIGANYLGYAYRRSTTGLFGLDYDFKLKTNTYDALLDWYPVQNNAFRFTGGVVYNGNRLDVNVRSNLAGSYTIFGHTYTSADAGKIEGSVDFRKVAPYLGIGWGNAAKKEKGWSFSADVGVLFQGPPRTSLTSTGCTAPTAACNLLTADLARENVALKEDAHKFEAYPVLRVGINYRF